MPRSRFALAVCQGLLLCAASSAGSLAASTCNLAEQPAATLLYPYFEVDVDAPGGRTTLLSIVNADTATPTLAHVVLWTDWGIPSASFDLFLAAPERLRAMHTGQPVDGGCFSAPREDESLATGYLTIDVVRRCSLGITLPLQIGSFGPTGVASTENRLWGDFYLVDSSEDFAQGQEAVHLVADEEGLGGAAPSPTFYAKFVAGQGTDARIPLPGELVGGPSRNGW